MMDVLLDTHVFLWWNSADTRLSPRVNTLLQDTQNRLFLSLASVWEIQIKIQLGKLHLPSQLVHILAQQQAINGLQLLPIELHHILELGALADIHRDPFDRLLVAQARSQAIPIVSDDRWIKQYAVEVIW